MSDEVNSTLMILVVGEFSLGILGNTFIGLINCVDWIKNKKIASIDLILTSLAISRICLLCTMLLDCFIVVLYPDILTSGKQRRIFTFFWTLSNHVSVWFATCLSIFYFLKIANFFHPLFLWMKWRINRVIPGILLLCLTLSVLISLPVTWTLNDDFRLCLKANGKTNLSWRCMGTKEQNLSTMVYVNLLTLLPFSVSLISFLLLILSLWRHVRRMQLKATGCRDPSTEAHVGAMKAVISFLLLFMVYSLCFLVVTSSSFMPESDLAIIIGELIALIYPCSHSFILILGNDKLRQASLRVLCKVIHTLKRRNY